MKTLFYNIAGAITETILGHDGSGKGLEGLGNCIEYINMIETVKPILNWSIAGLIAIFGLLIAYVIYDWFSMRKLEKMLVALEEKA